jgi:hypothetical protein
MAMSEPKIPPERRRPPDARISPERLAYWYLRLNGFLTLTNFIVHPDQGRNQETDVDVMGVRFPYRAENLARPMVDDAIFRSAESRILFRIAEVKAGRCSLNGPWTNAERRNMLRVLSSIGAFERAEAQRVADALYDKGAYENDLYDVALMCFGGTENKELASAYSNVQQVLWPSVLTFIFRRFRAYRNEKASHGQWDKDGHALWNAAARSKTAADFARVVRVE